MYYTGLDPFTMKEIYTPTDYGEKRLQRALLQWRRPENRKKIREAMDYCTESGLADLRELTGGNSDHRPKDETPTAKKGRTSGNSPRGNTPGRPKANSNDRSRGFPKHAKPHPIPSGSRTEKPSPKKGKSKERK
jgi:hypothetical protein